MITSEEKQAILQLIKEQVVPAIGCTEPIAVALCVAKATELLGCKPEHIELRLSANILKNAMGVGIPGTGMVGLPIAIALGALVGKPELELEVLRDSNKEAVEAGKQYIAENRIHIALEENDPDKLFINAIVTAGGHEAEARIKTKHTHFVLLRKDDDIRQQASSAVSQPECADCMTANSNGTAPKGQPMTLTLQKVYDFALRRSV